MFDVVIVGGGSAGCVLARRLADLGDRSVLLVEAGPDLRGRTPAAFLDGWRMPSGPDWPIDWGFESEPDANGATGKLRRGRVLGGTGWLPRFAARGAPADFDRWAALGNPGWRFEDVLPSFRRIEADVDFGDRPWHGADGPIPVSRYPDLPRTPIHLAALEAFDSVGIAQVEDHNAPDALGVGPMPMSTRDGRRATAVEALLGGASLPGGLEIRADSPVAQVEFEGRRATGVRLLDGTRIGAGEVVLAAGAYGSPTLLQRSGIGPGEALRQLGIPVVADLAGVGANLADHPAVDTLTGWQGRGTTAGPILHSIATLRSSSCAADGPPDLLFWIADPVGEEAVFSFDLLLMKPESRGSVRLRSADPAEPPRITLPGVTAWRDMDRLAEGLAVGRELASQPSIRRLEGAATPGRPDGGPELRAWIVAESYSIPHVVGTCRMGPAPEAGDVVDARGRVHGVDGLRVIDASILPEPPAGFPNLITMMVAEHLAAAWSS